MSDISSVSETCVAYGLVIQSELPLLPTMQTERPADVQVRFGNLQGLDSPGPNALLVQQSEATFLLRGGREVIVDAAPDVDRDALRAYLLGAVMAGILQQRGYLVLHASSVAHQGAAIAFLGGSGWGKSTLAAACCNAGYSLVTDDILAVQMGETGPTVLPSFPEVKLLADAEQVLDSCASNWLHSLSSKQIRSMDAHFTAAPLPLRKLYCLGVGPDLEITDLPKQATFNALLQHSRATRLLQDQQRKIQHFLACSQLAGAVPMAQLMRERDLTRLSDIVQAIAHDAVWQAPQPDLRD